MHPYHHSLSSVKKHGGTVDDYLPIHHWFDETKALFGDARHRALRHHTAGIFWCEEKFGILFTRADGIKVPVRTIAEQHVMEDMGCIPTVHWWLSKMPITYDMNRVPTRFSNIELPSDPEELKQRLVKEFYQGEG